MEQGTLFELPPQRGPIEPIVRTADIDGQYRWTLSRAWGAGPCLIWCGLNPSTADHRIDDPTVRREMRFSFLWGYGSMIKVNFYPLRSSTTPPLFAWLKKATREGPELDALVENWKRIALALKETQCEQPMAVWGNGANLPHLKEFLDFTDVGSWSDEAKKQFMDRPYMPAPKVQWHCLGLTGSGAPIHTLARGKHRIPDDRRPALWRTAA
jgi:hypothetical protein